MVNIEIDGKKLTAEAGSMIIEVADANDVYIPRFCYHKKLSVAANCRMCLVEVSNIPKAVPACATPVADGMVVQTSSDSAREAQKAVMEFLLINHPLDCPICDQGGECELQDLAVGFGDDDSSYCENKRVVHDKNIGPLIETEMTRCIHCTRCVRFGMEIAGIRELGMLGRGETAEIGTFVGKCVDSEVSGNIIDLCPVGALTAKPSRYKYRPWELQGTPSIAAHDCLGSNIDIHHRRGKVIRVVPRENEAVNEVWISDRDRYSYEALNSDSRLKSPMIKEDGQWKTVDWQTALERVVGGLNGVLQKHGSESIGALASPSATTEEFYLLQKLMRNLGSGNIDHRLRQLDFSDSENDPLFPELGRDIASLETLDASLLIGCNLRKELPLAALRLRKSTFTGKVCVINQQDYEFNFKLAEKNIVAADNFAEEIAAVLKAACEDLPENTLDSEWQKLISDVGVSDNHKHIADLLKQDSSTQGKQRAIILGAVAQSHADFATLRALARKLAEVTGASYGVISSGANSAGAYLAGAIPHRRPDEAEANGKNVSQMLADDLKAFLLLNVEPDKDTLQSEAALSAMKQAEFVVSLTPFNDGEVLDYADVLLPQAAFSETSGSYVNLNGISQSFIGAAPACGEARPGWKILRVLGNFMEFDGFDYESSEAVLDEMTSRIAGQSINNDIRLPASLKSDSGDVAEVGIYAIDSIVRRASALQQTQDALKAGNTTGSENMKSAETNDSAKG